jgi:hypothetical protein
MTTPALIASELSALATQTYFEATYGANLFRTLELSKQGATLRLAAALVVNGTYDIVLGASFLEAGRARLKAYQTERYRLAGSTGSIDQPQPLNLQALAPDFDEAERARMDEVHESRASRRAANATIYVVTGCVTDAIEWAAGFDARITRDQLVATAEGADVLRGRSGPCVLVELSTRCAEDHPVTDYWWETMNIVSATSRQPIGRA